MTRPLPRRFPFPAPYLYPEAQPWIQAGEDYKLQRAWHRLIRRLVLAALAVSLLAVLAVGVT